MTKCTVNQNYRIGYFQSGKFYFERDLVLSNDFKSLKLLKYNTPSTDKSGGSTVECEINIETNVGIILKPGYNLQFTNNASYNVCSGQSIFKTSESPKCEILPNGNPALLSLFIGIEDIRIGQYFVSTMPIADGFNLQYVDEGGGKTNVVLQAWSN